MEHKQSVSLVLRSQTSFLFDCGRGEGRRKGPVNLACYSRSAVAGFFWLLLNWKKGLLIGENDWSQVSAMSY